MQSVGIWPTRIRRTIRSMSGLLVIGATLIGPVACTRNPPPDPNAVPEDPVGPTTVRVQNQAFLDATVYVVRGGVRVRLGIATGSRTVVFTIPRTLVQPGTQLRFIANPIGGQRQPVSEEITVSPGDEVSLILPP